MMSILSPRYLSVLVLLIAFLAMGGESAGDSSSKKNGRLLISVTWGDAENSPATNVYIEAHGFVPKYYSRKSFILKSSLAGRYEASLPPAVYDVFISDGISVPACKRVLIQGGSTTSWTIQLDLDKVYMQK